MFYRVALTLACFALSWAGVDAQVPAGRVTGRVLDAINASPLPGVTVEVVGTDLVAHTDMDGRYTLALPAGTHQIKIALSGFTERVMTVTLAANAVRDLDVTLPLAGFSEMVSVVGQITEASTSSAAPQLLERRRATTINDNMGSQEMKSRGARATNRGRRQPSAVRRFEPERLSRGDAVSSGPRCASRSCHRSVGPTAVGSRPPRTT